MKKIALICLLITSSAIFSQSIPGLIIGDGVRIRSEGNASSKEVSKFHGMHQVEILEVSSTWDDLGKNEMCSRYKWVKIKWEGDSVGWVYGKYCYRNNGISCFTTKKTRFEFSGGLYHIMALANYEYPVADEDGLTGCNNTYKIFLYEEKTSSYYSINDAYSKKENGETTMVLYSNEGIGENISKIEVQSDKIIVYVDITYQEGKSNAIYSIQSKNGGFKVSGYVKAETKYD